MKLRLSLARFSSAFILIALGSAAWANVITGTGRPVDPNAWDGTRAFPSSSVTQLDNPRFSGSIFLESFERAERGPDGGVLHDRIRLLFNVGCGAGNPLCMETSLHTVHPLDTGIVSNGLFDFGAFGARLGHQPAELWFHKLSRDCSETEYAHTQARVDRETIIVPVHVAVEIPEGDSLLAALGGMAGVRKFQALFDDDFDDPTRVSTTTPPGTCVNLHQTGPIEHPDRTVHEETARLAGHSVRLVNLGKDVARPDDIFVQCGVQFRLASVTELRVQAPTIEFETDAVSANTAVLNFRPRIQDEQPWSGDERIVHYGDPTINAPVVAVMQNVGGGFSESAQNLGRTFGSVAGISVSRMDDKTVAHELGHTLGVTRDPEPHADCSGALSVPNKQLMCGGVHNYFMGGCDQWRDGVERRQAMGFVLCEPGPCPPMTVDLPVGCNPAAHPEAEPVCRDIRAGAAEYASALSGNKRPQIDLLDPDGNSLDHLPPGPAAGTFGTGARTKAVECGGELQVQALLLNDPTDPFPEISDAMAGGGPFTAEPSGWEIRYAPGSGASETEVITYPQSQQQVTIDLTRHLDDNIWIIYRAYDIQGLKGTSADAREGRPNGRIVITERTDRSPPIIEALPPVQLEGCAGGEPQLLSFPVDAAEDNCGEVTLTGQAIALNGQPLTPPIPLDETAGALLEDPGGYTIEWVATDEAGNQSDPALQTVTLDACMGAGSFLQVHNSVRLENPDGSPTAVMVLQPGTTRIGGQSRLAGVTSAAPVYVEGGAVVDGDVVSSGTIEVQAGAIVHGQVEPHQDLQLPSAPGIVGAFPSQCGSAVQYNADAGQHDLAPGCYQELRLGSRTRLVLDEGVYAFHRVVVEPDAVLITGESTGFDVRDELTFRGRLESPSGTAGSLALQYRGTNTAFIEAPYTGSVLAPEGTLVLGGNHGQVFRGRFYGKSLEVRAGLQVVSIPTQPTGVGTLSYRDLDSNLTTSSTSARSGGCAVSPGRPFGRWGVLVLLVWGGLALGRCRTKSVC